MSKGEELQKPNVAASEQKICATVDSKTRNRLSLDFVADYAHGPQIEHIHNIIHPEYLLSAIYIRLPARFFSFGFSSEN